MGADENVTAPLRDLGILDDPFARAQARVPSRPSQDPAGFE
ncbi:MAG TPA: hypothetical protein VFZ65_05540 [Planctomycetota bacterium]|nr:hypothetical protein [Planctomycetota bacterium]